MTHPLGEFVFLRKPGDCAPSAVRIALPADASLDALLDAFTDFVRACSYGIKEFERVGIVPDDDDYQGL